MARKFRREAQTLRDKALSSLKSGLDAYNSFSDEGRQTSTLLHIQHACEMLLKGALVQRRVNVFDQNSGISIGYEKSVRLAIEHCSLSDESAGALRAIDSLRDAEQHWFVHLNENMLFLHIRAVITAFDEIHTKVFRDRLSKHLPNRVLPLSSHPPKPFDALIGEEWAEILKLVRPGLRQMDDARARVRALLAMETHVSPDAVVSEKDIDRVVDAARERRAWTDVFPRLDRLASEVVGEGPTIQVRFSKKEGAPVRFIEADDPAEAAAIRQVDLQKKYRYSPTEIARHINLTVPKSKILRDHIKLEEDPACYYLFEFGSQKMPRYSDRAIQRLREALGTVDIDELWRNRRRRRGGAP